MSVYVTKTDGRKEPFSVEKVKKVIAWAVRDSAVSPLVLESKFDEFIKDGISTNDIQNNLIYHARILCTPEEPDWSFVAGRLETMRLWKRTGIYEKTFAYYLKEKIDAGIYKHPGFLVWTKNEITDLGKEIVQERDLDHSYGSVLTAMTKYLLPGECIQQMHMANAMIIASVEPESTRLDFAKKVYHALSLRKVSLATPWLSNLRSGRNISSCFIIQVDDSMESIANGWKNAALISKDGGGLGIDLSLIRAANATIDGRINASKGVTSWTKIFNDIAVAVDQGGRRAGAFTVHCPIWHRDIEDFLELQTEQGDFRRKAFDVFPQVGVYDIFMREVQKEDGGTWHTFCPTETERAIGVKITGVFGKEFENRYKQCVKAYKAGQLTNVGVYNAKELLKHVMRVQFETGLPYIAFLDAINEANPNAHDGYIPAVNLCVAPETQILTDEGYVQISDKDGAFVNVWNGSEFSRALVRKTGRNQQLIKIETSGGQFLECTPYHKFYVQDSYRSEPIEKQAAQLSVGDKLVKFDLPVINGHSRLDKAYANGFFTADGHTTYGRSYIYLYGEKRRLKERLDLGCGWYEESDADRSRSHALSGLAPKFFVPAYPYDITSRIEWLAGLMDGDGTISRNVDNESVQISSINKEFLLETQLMLQTLGVSSKVGLAFDRRETMLPDGNGGEKIYSCQKLYRLLINSNGLFKLSNLGLKTSRLQFVAREPQRDAERFLTVTAIKDEGRIDDTYCFEEPKRHLGMFNGILTGQCTESFSNVQADKYAHTCNLASIVVGRIDSDREMKEISGLTCHILDNGITLTKNPIKESQAHNERYRTIGIGIQGLHDWVAKNRISWKDYASFSKLAEIIQYGALEKSAALAEERGSFPAFEGSKWHDGSLVEKYKKNSTSEICDWDSLGVKIMRALRNSQLTSPAPNTSTAPFMDASPGVMPVWRAFFNEDNKSGKFSVFGMYLKENPLSYEQTQPRQDQAELTKVVGTLQKWIDTGISAEFVFDLNREDVTAKSLFDLIISAWKNRMKAIYYIRSIKKGNSVDDLLGGESVCVGCTG